MTRRELSIFIDESGDFGPYEAHSPYYVLSLVLHDQADEIAEHLARIHRALEFRGLPRDVAHHSWLFNKREYDTSDDLVSTMSRDLGALIRDNYAYFMAWDRIIIYYDNGQREITNLVNSVFNALLGNVEVRKVQPSAYPLPSSRPVLHAHAS